MMNWKKYQPLFEYEKKFNDSWWPWYGHRIFAYDYLRNVKPKIIVELGTHKGTSLFSFCQAIKDGGIDCEVNAVDTWEGDDHAGFYGDEIFQEVCLMKDEYYKNVKVNFLRMTFDKAVGNFEDESIDLLHIDGLHTYDAVKHDFKTWLPKMKKNGVIFFHDIVVTRSGFGVYKYWKELKEHYDLMEFRHSYGLGVLFLDGKYFSNILKDDLEMYYSYLVEDKENEKINILENQFCLEKDKNQKLETIILNQDRKIKEMENSKFWKLRNKYLGLKSFIK